MAFGKSRTGTSDPKEAASVGGLSSLPVEGWPHQSLASKNRIKPQQPGKIDVCRLVQVAANMVGVTIEVFAVQHRDAVFSAAHGVAWNDQLHAGMSRRDALKDAQVCRMGFQIL